jgi:hypothetical protein
MEAQRFDHLRHQRRLCRHLVVRDRKRGVVVGVIGEIARNERGARDGMNGLKQALLADAQGAQRGDEIGGGRARRHETILPP